MKSLFVSAFVGFGVTLGAFALFADNSFWSQAPSEASVKHEDSATLALTSEPSVQDHHKSSQETDHHKSDHKSHRKPQSDEMSIALRPQDSKKVASKSVEAESQVKAYVPSSHEAKSGKWSVQIASFKSEPEAAGKLDAMKKEGLDGFIETAEVNGSSVYRVKIGPVVTKTEAQALQAKITQMPGLAGSILSKAKN